jgi:H2-forming N5,N10-methylenetetrahydromethanopterin dehydrogenase-like enzyme
MKFLADESCAGPVIQALREAGHDVVAIAEVARGAVDEAVMARVERAADPDYGRL